jgi:hypothetical protein
MRRYLPNWEQYGIDKERYLELLHMCRQYPLWKQKLADLSGIQALKMDSQPHGTDVGDPVASLAEKRERFLRKVELIESCARDIGDGAWAKPLIQNVCYDQKYFMLDPLIMPTANRNAFFNRKREFFILLDERAEAKDIDTFRKYVE